MLLKWILWKYFLRRTAKIYDIIDLLTLLARLRIFGQPSEIQEPIELLREGVKYPSQRQRFLQTDNDAFQLWMFNKYAVFKEL